MKAMLGIFAGALVVAAYIPYLRDAVRGRTRPHLYSWLMWALLTVIIFGIQITHGAGPGGFVTLAAGAMCVAVIALSLRHGRRDITAADHALLLAAMAVTVLWLAARQALAAMLLACLADLLAFAPTVRKSWSAPWSETLSFYGFNAVRFSVAAAALNHYSLTTLVWPLMWSACNGTFALVLVARRRRLATPAW